MSNKQVVKDDFEPFGPEWEKYMMTLPKKFIIDLYRDKCLEAKTMQNEKKKSVDIERGIS